MSTFFLWPKVRGNFPKDGTYIIMMNHSSFLDAFIFPLIPRGYYSGVTAASNFKIPVFSSLIRRIQAIPIERNNLQSAINSIKQAEAVLMQGIHIGILPEGTRTLNGLIGPLKKGGFHMAINTSTPIIPVGISGAFDFKPKNRWWIRPTTITVKIGEIINIDKYENLGLDGLKNLVEVKLKYLSGENK
jgi:1-acyl-sn-glycerol-3-phosphate acyltransferase